MEQFNNKNININFALKVDLNEVLQNARANYSGENDLESLDNYRQAMMGELKKFPAGDIETEQKILVAGQLRSFLFTRKIEEIMNLRKVMSPGMN